MVGDYLEKVWWRNSNEPGIATFLLFCRSSLWYSLSPGKVCRAARTEDMKDLSSDYTPPVLTTSKVRELRAGGEGETHILFENGYLLTLTFTFDGTNVGNNLILDSPEEWSDWKEEYLRFPTIEVG